MAATPLVVLVENRQSDGAFVERVIEELDRDLDRWWKRSGGDQGDGPTRVDSVGGKGQMLLEVTKKAKRTPRPRYVVIVDSDRTQPGVPPSIEERRLLQQCNQLDVPCWVLAKREAENYLVSELLDAAPNRGLEHRRRTERWDALDAQQKDIYDMRDGLPNPVDAPFDTLSDPDRALLEPGFGPAIGYCWPLRPPRNIAAALQQRGGGDLEHGLELLRSEV